MTTNDVVRLVELTDFESLKEAYLKRHFNFKVDIQPHRNENFNKILTKAVLSTEFCMKTYIEFRRALHDYLAIFIEEMKKEKFEYEKISTQIADELQPLLEIEDSNNTELGEIPKSFLKYTTNMLYIDHKIHKDLYKSKLMMDRVKLNHMVITHTNLYNSLYAIFTEKDFGILLEFIEWGLKNLVGIFPIFGPFAVGSWELAELTEKISDPYKDINEFFIKMDNYIIATLNWCVITQSVIEVSKGNVMLNYDPENTENGSNFNKEDFANIANQVIERYNKFSNSSSESTLNEFDPNNPDSI